jgi:C4-dicarboxylate-specific signal transduction histidine kinase
VVVDVASSASFGRSYVGLPPALYTCLPFAIWAAIRFGIPGLSTCLLLATYLTINSPFGAGLAAGPMTVEAIVGVQMFVALAASSLMFLSVVREETRQIQRTEEALYHSEAKSAAILRALPDLMFVQSKDSDHRYLEYYARDERDLLVSPEAFVGKRMRDVLPPDLAQSFEELFVRATSSAEPQILEYALPIRGEEHRFEARVVVCDDDRLLAIVRDVTEQKQAEAALQKADQALARMSQASALGQLAASIAHEVQQPLSAISINAAACLRSLEDDSADAHHLTNALTDIMEDSRRAGQVIKRTRELFGGGARQNVPVDLNSAIVEVLALTRHRAERNGQSVRAELDAGRLVVTGDRVQLQQVLLNLIVNGLDAMNAMTGPNRSVVVRSWRDHGLVHVAVQDAGQGFDPTDIERMFHTFYTTKSDGLGIGLAISRSIIQAHGGQLTAKLNPSGGATFELAIPEAEISAGEAALHPSQMFRREGSRSSGSEIQS